MPYNITFSKKLIIVTSILIMSILMISILPFIVPGMLEDMENSQKIRNEELYAEFEPQELQLVTTIRTMSWSYPFWTAITMLAGFILLFSIKPYFVGEKWTKPLVMVCFAIPSITGAFMLTTYYHFLGFEAGFSPGFYFLFLGLIGYFTIILVDISGARMKALYFWIFFMLGLIAAEALVNGITCHVILESNPAIPFYTNGVFLLYITRIINWLAIIFILIAIYFITIGRKIGWYFAIIVASSTSFIGFIMQTVRTDTHDFLYQGLMGLALLITLLLPTVKQRLFKN